jgi:uncharacterized DUF497 family protein
MEFSGFDWDEANRVKCQKHGVSIAEIEDLFGRVVSVAPDAEHSLYEERLKAIGVTKEGRRIFVAFTLRQRGEETVIRPVSARYMHRKEVEFYEKETSDSDKR